MPIYKGVLVEKRYFSVEVEADTWEEAKLQIWHSDYGSVINEQWDLYDLEEKEKCI
jgi:hypothetical protein